MAVERRSIDGQKVSIVTREDGGKTLVGYASVFYDPNDSGTEFRLGEKVVERVARSAFDRSLSEGKDIVSLYNHTDGVILGRRSAGTLRLSVDAKGLKYEVDLPETTAGKDTAISVERKDIVGSSFTFIPKSAPISRSGDLSVRTLEDVDLIEVSPVIFAAYKSATASMRAQDTEAALEEVRKFEEQGKAVRSREVATRLRILELQQNGS